MTNLSSAVSRIVHLTFHKCGSQWVRDVLTAPEIVKFSGVPLAAQGIDLLNVPWPDQKAGTFIGPVYNASRPIWQAAAKPKDRAIVVLRDPRDRLVSWVFSSSYSHRPNPIIDLVREPLLSIDDRRRLLLGLFEFHSISMAYYSWGGQAKDENIFLTTYEKFIADEFGEFQRIVSWLGWKVPKTVLTKVVERLSFQNRSGRVPGKANIYSHYRRGVAGDWRNYFDRDLGERFEALRPGLLVKLGYEKSSLWFKKLPERLHRGAPKPAKAAELHKLRADIVRLNEQRAEFDKSLAAIKTETNKRLEQLNVANAEIEALSASIRQQQKEMKRTSTECSSLHKILVEREEALKQASGESLQQKAAADERLQQLQAKEKELKQLQNALAQARAAQAEVFAARESLQAAADERLKELKLKDRAAASLRTEADKRLNQFNAAGAEIKHLSASIRQQQKEMEQAGAELSSLQKTLAEREQALQQASQESRRQKAAADERLQQLQAKEKELKQLQTALAQARAAQAEVLVARESLQAAADERLKELKLKDQAAASLRTEADKRLKQFNAAGEEIKRLSTSIRQQQKEMERAGAELSSLQKILSERAQALQQASGESLRQKTAADERLQQLQAKEKELVQLQSALAQARTAQAELLAARESLQAAADERLVELQAKQTVIDELKQACDAREALIHSLQGGATPRENHHV